jgi:hypothetical protein
VVGPVVPVPVLEPEEEHPQGAETVGPGVHAQARLVLPGAGGQPWLVGLDVAAFDGGDAADVRVVAE